jgi:hypothetical protein
MRGGQTDRSIVEIDDHVAVQVGPEHARARRRQHRHDGLRRVPEVVVLADAHQRRLGSPDVERLLRETVRAPMVGYLQHVDIAQQAERSHPSLGSALGIAGQHRRRPLARELEDDARVVRLE